MHTLTFDYRRADPLWNCASFICVPRSQPASLLNVCESLRGEMKVDVEVDVHWSDDRALIVEREDDRLVVQAHASLSHGLVKAACAELGPDGPHVLAAWERTVGIGNAR